MAMEYNNPEMEKPLPDLGDNKTVPEGREGHGQAFPSGQIHIPRDMIPEDVAKKIKVGDVLEFKVTAEMDPDGDFPVVYNTGKETGDSWEEGLRAEMSPRAGEKESGY